MRLSYHIRKKVGGGNAELPLNKGDFENEYMLEKDNVGVVDEGRINDLPTGGVKVT